MIYVRSVKGKVISVLLMVQRISLVERYIISICICYIQTSGKLITAALSEKSAWELRHSAFRSKAFYLSGVLHT